MQCRAMPYRRGRSSGRWAKPRGGPGSPTRRPRARRPDGAAPPVPPPPRSNARCRRGSAPGGAARRRAPGSGQRREAPRCGRAAAQGIPPSRSSHRGNEAGRGCDRRSWPGPQARASRDRESRPRASSRPRSSSPIPQARTPRAGTAPTTARPWITPLKAGLDSPKGRRSTAKNAATKTQPYPPIGT